MTDFAQLRPVPVGGQIDTELIAYQIVKQADILYIHPYGHLDERVVPTGAISAVNALGLPCRGLYAHDVTPAAIRGAKVILADVHWAMGLNGAARLIAEVARLNPCARTVVGGITASAWPERVLNRLKPDFVVQGDAEEALPPLVRALLADREPLDLPNVWRRDGSPPPVRRISSGTFSRSDSISCHWFASYEEASNRPRSSSFSPARWVIVARSCIRRCRVCYGSYASAFGAASLYRTPESTSWLVRRAAQQNVRRLRLFFGYLEEPLLRMTLAALAAHPRSFSGGVGIFLCSPLDRSMIEMIRDAFPDTTLSLSVVWPTEHELAPGTHGSDRPAEERYLEMARLTTGRMETEFWYTKPATAERLEAGLEEVSGEQRHGSGAPAEGRFGTGLARARRGFVWNMARPDERTAGGDPALVEQQWQRAASLSVEAPWFEIARLVSPPLAELFRVFGDLDHLRADPRKQPPPEGGLAAYWEEALEGWASHGFPLLPRLRFYLVPVRSAHGVRTTADSALAHFVPGHTLSYAEGALWTPLRRRYARRSPTLRGAISERADALWGVAIVPALGEDTPCAELLLGEVLALDGAQVQPGATVVLRPRDKRLLIRVR